MTTEAILLGIAQDAGVPQAGCYCANCQPARANPAQRQLTVCLGLIDHTTGQSWLIDATPDFKEQLHALHQAAPTCSLAGIILTHIHMGHYTGLIHLGPEAMNSRRMPLFVSAAVANFLSHNQPWAFLVEREHLDLRLLSPNLELPLSPNLHLNPLPVPHRAEFSDTCAFVIRGPQRSLFYCPDIDGWDTWGHHLPDFVSRVDMALLDAAFFSPAELPGRDLRQIPHPLVTDTVARLVGVQSEVSLIHLNHTNPLLHDGPEREWLRTQGFQLGRFGQRWML